MKMHFLFVLEAIRPLIFKDKNLDYSTSQSHSTQQHSNLHTQNCLPQFRTKSHVQDKELRTLIFKCLVKKKKHRRNKRKINDFRIAKIP